ncbi:MAG: class I tRNA ligase family protein [Candidatus Staskawiczbacteria bacterium]|jgi:methionyl-tRNA synthetase
MFKRNKKFYITTSIPYTNALPHIGFALEAVQADVLARYHRLQKDDTFFLTGTDEHGIKTARAAKVAGKDPQEFADEISGRFLELTKALNISNDDFIRTTDETRHRPAVEKVWKKLQESGDIYKKNYKGFYCAGCEAFIPEKDLVEGKCSIHQKELEVVEEENYFFKLSKYTERIEKLIKDDKLKIIPETRKNETLSMLKQGMEDVSFSRTKDKYWGFPVPGDSSQIIYVWCDALPNYISAIGYYEETEQFKKYWPADAHCIGKDIMKFHTIFWPAMLLSLGLELPKIIFVHGFVTVDNQKMSKSLGNVIDPFSLIEKYGVDAVRYYLLKEILPGDDGDFTYQKFEERYNADLVSGIGNLVARVLAIAENIEIKGLHTDSEFKKEIEKTEEVFKELLLNFRFNEAVKAVWDLISFCDKYIEKNKPWETKDPQVIYNLLVCLAHIAQLLKPILPETAERISQQLGVGDLEKKTVRFEVKRGDMLFKRICLNK